MNILLIEDDPGIGRFVSQGLTGEGYAVEWLRTGRDVPRRLRAESFTAAILDLGLPDIDGLDLCRSLRHEGVETPILMLTARDTLEDKLDGFGSGADDYLSKPFAFAELLARLKAVARRGPPAPGRILTVGVLKIDLTAREVTVGAEALSLPRREFEVLAAIAHRPGHVVSRQQILDAAWGAEAEITENSVDVYVGYLRRRLAHFSPGPRIETVRGVGFKILE
jgi:DNA-binding response OmpR family regulator